MVSSCFQYEVKEHTVMRGQVSKELRTCNSFFRTFWSKGNQEFRTRQKNVQVLKREKRLLRFWKLEYYTSRR